MNPTAEDDTFFKDLPPPTVLKQAMIVHYDASDEPLRLICGACEAIEIDHTPIHPTETCLYLLASPWKLSATDKKFRLNRYLIPCKYISYITLGPEIEIATPGNPDIVVVPSDKAASKGAMGVATIKATIAEFQDIAD